MASIINELRDRQVDFTLIHTGQHYDNNMSNSFFEELELPSPTINLDIGNGTQAEQTATALVRLEEAFRNFSPDFVLVEGDTNSVLAGALAASKLGIKVGHVEAGLRSYDLRMPEEHNRRLTDHLSNYLFAPTTRAASTLRAESCWGSVYVTGNTVIDACLQYGPKARRVSPIMSRIPFEEYALATIHRAENVDNPSILRELVELFRRSPVPVVYPVHPRTKERLVSVGLWDDLENCPDVVLLPPVTYFDFLTLLMNCNFVLTDSGGVQEESSAPNIRKKSFVLRESTERPEAVEAGFSEVVGTKAEKILTRMKEFLGEDWVPPIESPFGDGTAGLRIVSTIESEGLISRAGLNAMAQIESS